MAIAYQIGPFFVQMLRLRRGAPIFELAPTHEQVEPYRTGRCLIVKYWSGRAVAIGRWTGEHESEEAALKAGLGAREVDMTDESGKILERYKARDTIASKSADVDQEWQILNVLDLLEDDGKLTCPEEAEEDDECGSDCGCGCGHQAIVILDLDEEDDR